METNAAEVSQAYSRPTPTPDDEPARAVTALYEAHALGLIRLAVVMLGDRGAAEDVVQEAFCGLYRRWHVLTDTDNAHRYVRSSVINGCRTLLRRRARQHGDPRWELLEESAESAARPPRARHHNQGP